MSLFREGSSVALTVRVEMRASCGTPLGKVSEFMDVDSVFLVGVEAPDRACDLGRGGDGVLTEGSDSSDIGVVGVEDANGVPVSVGGLILI